MKKMTYDEIYRNHSCLSIIEIRENDKSLPAKDAAMLVLCKAAYRRAFEKIETAKADALKELKKEGFDQRAQNKKWYDDYMKRVKDKETVSKEDKKRAAEIKPTIADFEKELAELDEAYREALKQIYAEPVEVAYPSISPEVYASICETFGMEGNIITYMIDANRELVKGDDGEPIKNEVPRLPVLMDIAAYLVG